MWVLDKNNKNKAIIQTQKALDGMFKYIFTIYIVFH